MSYPRVPYPYPPPAPPPTSGMAVASLVLGILGLPLGFCTLGVIPILAIIFGHSAQKVIRETGRGGRGIATAGLVLGYVGLSFAVLTVLVGILNAILESQP